MNDTRYAWFSAASALAHGSFVFRKPGGSTINVTRMSSTNVIEGRYRHDEKYVGQVISAEDGGCVEPRTRVQGITYDRHSPRFARPT